MSYLWKRQSLRFAPSHLHGTLHSPLPVPPTLPMRRLLRALLSLGTPGGQDAAAGKLSPSTRLRDLLERARHSEPVPGWHACELACEATPRTETV